MSCPLRLFIRARKDGYLRLDATVLRFDVSAVSAKTAMLHALTRKWWVLLINGLLVTALGVLAFVVPQVAAFVLLLVCATYWLLDGLQSIFVGVSLGRARSRLSVSMLVGGILSIAAAVFVLGWPNGSLLTLTLALGVWAILRGVYDIVAGFHLRRFVSGESLYYLLGASAVVFGLISLWRPIAGALFLVWLLGAFALIRGITLCALAFELREIRRLHELFREAPFAPNVSQR